ncbi:MAG: aldo/keto reductase [Myxococcota bacterium]|nr:aldo/keto reductase [Myxococcota bacterium]
MQLRRFGQSELRVSPLGFGTGMIGGPELSEDQVGSLLNQLLDLGVNLFDTAPSYGAAEERIGRHLSWRRSEVILSTKGGYGTEFPDWTGSAIMAGVEGALRRMRTDHLDLFHLHSCPLEVLRRENILEACRSIVASGKVKVAAYSGEEEALAFAVESGVFGGIQCSVNLCDQRSLDTTVAEAHRRGLGVIAKRPLANAVWLNRPNREDAAAVTYQARFPLLGLAPGQLPWDELFLRFAAYAPGVTSCIVGSSNLGNLRKNVEAVSRGPLPPNVFNVLRESFARVGQDWPGQI